MRVFLVLALLYTGVAEGEEFNWYEGSVELVNGEVVIDKISIMHGHEAILIKKSRGFDVVPAHKITSFQYFDSSKKVYRKFKVITTKKKGVTSRKFYELVVEGDVKVLRRFIYHNDFLLRYQNASKKRLDDSTKSYNYDYFVYTDNNLIPFKKFRSKVLPILNKKHKAPLRDYIERQSLDINILSHCVELVKFYNELVSQGSNLTLLENP